MNIIFISDIYPPYKKSSSHHLEYLVQELAKNNNLIYVFSCRPNQTNLIESDSKENIKFYFLKTFNIKSKNLALRFIAELTMPIFFILFFKFKIGSRVKNIKGIIWYSPSIFFGPLIYFLRNKYNCKSYLILRDIFPQWALDLKIINRNIVYYILKFFEYFQYKQASVIGVQSKNNLSYFTSIKLAGRIEILNNWLSIVKSEKSGINIRHSKLKNRIIFIYSGNLGQAQNIFKILHVAALLKNNKRIGFLLIGRGSDFDEAKKYIYVNNLENVLLYNEISINKIQDVYKQCHFGIISLHSNHKFHNIPGKFLSYLQAGLPVIAAVNKYNDIIKIIRTNELGLATSSSDSWVLKKMVLELSNQFINRRNMSINCKNFFKKAYSANMAANQIMHSLISK
jgi:hypothetical protein